LLSSERTGDKFIELFDVGRPAVTPRRAPLFVAAIYGDKNVEEATKSQLGSRGIAVFFNFGVRWSGWSTPRPDRFTSGK
jgi:hypothetical protein